MKITVDRNVVELVPESPRETEELQLLWRVMVDCLRENKKMVPIGEYIPTKQNLARFVIEGIPGGKTEWSQHKADEDHTYYCAICNKYMNVHAGDAIPLCCGREMERLD
ncbi:MAG TPA: hypothetical protein EYP57_02910 [Thermodesulfobacteriaceae bacterium]|nr:hypothetical protein [Thermodesulfobacteriaceae bacterium]